MTGRILGGYRLEIFEGVNGQNYVVLTSGGGSATDENVLAVPAIVDVNIVPPQVFVLSFSLLTLYLACVWSRSVDSCGQCGLGHHNVKGGHPILLWDNVSCY